jgi:hypothetical protein
MKSNLLRLHGVTPAEIALTWQTAAPRMPIRPLPGPLATNGSG